MAGDDVPHRLRLVPGILQGVPVLLGLPLCLGKLLPGAGAVRLQAGPALLDLPVFRSDGGKLRSVIRSGSHGHGLLSPQGLRPGLGAAGLVCGGLGLGQQLVQRLLQLRRAAVDLRYPGLLLRRLALQAAGTAVAFRQLCPGPFNVLPVVGDGALQHRHGALLLLGTAIQSGRLRPDLFSLHILFLHPAAVLLSLCIKGVQLGPGLVPGGLGSPEIRLQFAGSGFEFIQILQPDGDLQKTHLIPQQQILLRPFRLIPQRLHLELQLADLVVDADQILLRPLQLPLRVLLAVAEFGDTGGLFKNLPALAAFGREDLIDLALANDGVALLAHAGVQEQFRHILEPDRLAVDVVLTFPAAVIPAGHRHLRLLHGGKDMSRIVQNQRHLGKPHRGPLLRAAKDDVLHLGAPQSLGALLAHDPADGV